MLEIFLSFVSSALILPHQEKSFVSFMRKNRLVYTGDEYHFRLGIFLAQSRYVQSFNAGKHGFKVSLNKFACLTSSEYKVMTGSWQGSQTKVSVPVHDKDAGPPDSWDWRNQEVVQDVKDQGQCGSCWAFSAIAAQETQWALSHANLYSLSEQNLIDCVTDCDGCNGGDKATAYQYVIDYQSGQFNSESDYPYVGTVGTCQFSSTAPLTYLLRYIETPAGNESALLEAVYYDGTVAVSIDASHTSFQLYSGGVYDEPSCSSTTHDHAVACVGYGSDGSTPYWIVKNSWGVDWGEQGYIRMSRNKNNQCCIACAPVIPIDI